VKISGFFVEVTFSCKIQTGLQQGRQGNYKEQKIYYSRGALNRRRNFQVRHIF